MSFGYDDIPEDEESASPAVSNALLGLTLDQYMSRMVTTPASAAATSGLGASAAPAPDSGGSTPCSPGNASSRTEEDDSPKSPRPARGSNAAGAAAAGSGRLLPTTTTAQAAAAAPAAGSSGRTTGLGMAAAVAAAPPPPPIIPRLAPPSAAGRSPAVASQPLRPTGATGSGSLSASNSASGAAGGGRPGAGGVAALPIPSGRLTPTVSSMSTIEDMFGSGSNMGPGGHDVGFLLDAGTSDDEGVSPSMLLDSPRNARRLSSRASAMAFSNSLDLRPATAAVMSSPSMTRGEGGGGRGLAADGGNHHALVKQVDLGGLSASLFTPNPSLAAPASASASGAATSNPSSPDIAAVVASRGERRAAAAAAAAAASAGSGSGGGALISPSGSVPVLRSPSGPTGSGDLPASALPAHVFGDPKLTGSPKMSAPIPPPWGVSAREGAFGGGPAGDGAGGAASLSGAGGAAAEQSRQGRRIGGRGKRRRRRRRACGPGRRGVGDSACLKRQPDGAVAMAASPGGVSGPLDHLPPEARALAAEAQGLARPPTRQVQSARPPGTRGGGAGEMELDPSVWEANIAMQLQRPPSRQKPPPEALHLWTPEQQMSMLAGGGLGGGGLGGLGLGRGPGGGPGGGPGRPLGGRPQSAAPTTYRGGRPASGPSVKAQGPVGEDVAGTSARPPSRQKPPPLSTLLEHDDFPPPPPGRRGRPPGGGEQLDVVMSGDSESDDLDDL
ncbi:hypothetical protein GPECTOR_68g351 [Gonium pectorale]|uniref:Uncharacterized protein n=1 Tax=Gonium pectorale TaxID=33097 RepID=A0A150G4Z9_GONPE|nr:hypothetical protein GPECTOR_68g351 [Gonium pectorale]|eukprot:KXZ44380.1 hypothetical protein GPECTOR_68g351 [Gonium pectorale]